MKELKSLTDDELFDELRCVVNDARFKAAYDREWARKVGEECRKRGILGKEPFPGTMMESK